MLRMITKAGVAAALMLSTAVGIASCSSSGASRSSSPAANSAVKTTSRVTTSPQSAPSATTFRSHAYGYSLTVPVGLTPRQAFAKWDGKSELDGDSAYVDLIGDPAESRGVWVAATPWKQDLAAFTAYMIIWNFHFHGDYCPEHPETRGPVTVGGEAGVLFTYNCGILVNNVATVRHGIGYFFVFVDQDVAAANNPADHAVFMKMLASVTFPG